MPTIPVVAGNREGTGSHAWWEWWVAVFSLWETISWISCSTIPLIMLNFLPNLKFRTKKKTHLLPSNITEVETTRTSLSLAWSSWCNKKMNPSTGARSWPTSLGQNTQWSPLHFWLNSQLSLLTNSLLDLYLRERPQIQNWKNTTVLKEPVGIVTLWATSPSSVVAHTGTQANLVSRAFSGLFRGCCSKQLTAGLPATGTVIALSTREVMACTARTWIWVLSVSS